MPFTYFPLSSGEENGLFQGALIPGLAWWLVVTLEADVGINLHLIPWTVYLGILLVYAKTFKHLIERLINEKEKVYLPPRSDAHGHFGRLVVFEGLDGSGKSTQVELLVKYLKSYHCPTFVTNWSTLKLNKLTNNGEQLLSPGYISNLQLKCFQERHNEIVAALKRGDIVVCDRYFYTALARDKARGRSFVHNYDFATTPDIVFYFDIEADTAVERVLRRIEINRRNSDDETTNKLSFYEAGLDLKLDRDPVENFKKFQARTAQAYSQLRSKYDMTLLPAYESERFIHDQVVSAVLPIVPTKVLQISKRCVLCFLAILILYLPIFVVSLNIYK